MRLDRWAVLVAVLTAALTWLVGPCPAELGDETTGDAELAARVRELADDGEGYRGLSVALVERGAVRVAGFGEDGAGRPVGAETAFEIGSIGKVLTGMLLADLARDGIVHPEDTLGELLPTLEFEDPDTAGTTLAELSSHRAGLPRLRTPGPVPLARPLLSSLAGTNPYGGADTDWLLSTMDGAEAAGGEQEVGYSNYGVAVLGHTLAQRAGAPFPELVRQRILEPLAMGQTGYERPERSARGSTAGGRAVDPWRGSGYAPAGVGAWSTAGDLAMLVASTMDGVAPGADAADPRFDAGSDERIGYGWFTERSGGREITWHNGGTGGFRSYVGFDRAAGRGVVALGNTNRPVEGIGRRLLGAGEDRGGGFDAGNAFLVGMTVFFSVAGALGLLGAARQAGIDRLRLVSNGVWAAAMPALGYAVGAWETVPPVVWALGAGLSGYAVVRAVRRWPAVPLNTRRYRWLAWTGVVLNCLVGAAVVALALVR